jgi:hypothetical protein
MGIDHSLDHMKRREGRSIQRRMIEDENQSRKIEAMGNLLEPCMFFGRGLKKSRERKIMGGFNVGRMRFMFSGIQNDGTEAKEGENGKERGMEEKIEKRGKLTRMDHMILNYRVLEDQSDVSPRTIET